jgi:hypothetical protein
MRLLLIVLIAVIAFAVVQSYRHGCKIAADAAWVNCVLGRSAVEATTPPAAEAPAPAAEPAPAEPAPAPQ